MQHVKFTVPTVGTVLACLQYNMLTVPTVGIVVACLQYGTLSVPTVGTVLARFQYGMLCLSMCRLHLSLRIWGDFLCLQLRSEPD